MRECVDASMRVPILAGVIVCGCDCVWMCRKAGGRAGGRADGRASGRVGVIAGIVSGVIAGVIGGVIACARSRVSAHCQIEISRPLSECQISKTCDTNCVGYSDH